MKIINSSKLNQAVQMACSGTRNLILGLTLFAMCSVPVKADFLSDKMNDALGGMVNVTNPAVYQSATRTVVTAGGIAVRNKIFNQNVVSFTPPGVSAGCGGIDMWSGSFSFINADQLIALFRAVAANAVPLLFHMALSHICKECSNLILSFQRLVQAINNLLSNSCQLAMGIVSDVENAFTKQRSFDASAQAMALEVGSAADTFINGVTDIFTNKTSTSLVRNASASTAENSNLYGNLTLNAALNAGINTMFGTNSNEIYDVVMSLVGTIVVHAPESTGSTVSADGTATNDTGETQKITRIPVSSFGISDFVEGFKQGSNKQIYYCKDGYAKGRCLSVGTKNYSPSIGSLREYVARKLCGNSGIDECSDGILAAFASNNSGQATNLSSADMTIFNTITSANKSFRAAIVQLAVEAGGSTHEGNTTSTGRLGQLVDNYSGLLATYLAYTVIKGVIDAARASLPALDSEYSKELMQMYDRANDDLVDEYQRLRKYYGEDKLDDLIEQALGDPNTKPDASILLSTSFATQSTN